MRDKGKHQVYFSAAITFVLSFAQSNKRWYGCWIGYFLIFFFRSALSFLAVTVPYYSKFKYLTFLGLVLQRQLPSSQVPRFNPHPPMEPMKPKKKQPNEPISPVKVSINAVIIHFYSESSVWKKNRLILKRPTLASTTLRSYFFQA